jgi:hypothetical protein
MATPGREAGCDGTPALAEPELVHEVLERIIVAAGQPARWNAGRVLRGPVQERGDLNEESLLATCAYIDLNPVAAGLAEVPEASPHTSIKKRVEHGKAQNRANDLQATKRGSVVGSIAPAGVEESLWLCPIENSAQPGFASANAREQWSHRRPVARTRTLTWHCSSRNYGASPDRINSLNAPLTETVRLCHRSTDLVHGKPSVPGQSRPFRAV